MLRRVMMVAAWMVLVSAARGEEKYTFSVEVENQDVFEFQRQQVVRLGVDEQRKGSAQTRIEATLTMTQVEGGQAHQIDMRITKATKSEATQAGLGVAVPVLEKPTTIRYEWIGGKYKPRFLEGDLTPKVSEILEEEQNDPLRAGLLPTKPLAVGESERVDLNNRLGIEGLTMDENGKLGNDLLVIDKPATITLQKVETEDGKRTAYLTLSFKAHTKETAEEADGSEEPTTIGYDETILFDLDRKFITQSEVKMRMEMRAGVGEASVLSYMNVVQVTQFQKK